MTKRTGAPVLSIGDAAASARDQLLELRRWIDEVEAELEQERARPVTLAQAKARAAEAVAKLREAATGGLYAHYFLTPEGGVSDNLLNELASHRVTSLSLAAALAPEALIRLLTDKLEAVAPTLPAGVDDLERRRRVSMLRTRLAELERQEADAWWSSAAAGLDLPLRVGLNPAALLGLDEVRT